MAASSSDKFQKVGNTTSTNLAAPYTSGGTTMTVNSTAGWPTDTGITFAVDSITLNGQQEVQTPGTYTIYHGVVTNSTTLTNVVLAAESPNAAQNYASGSLTRVYMPISAATHNRMVEGLVNSHNQDGTLKNGAVNTAAVLADSVVTTSKLNADAVDTNKLGSAAIATRHLGSGANLKIPSANLAPSKSTDANGWTVYDYGSWKEYRKRVTFSNTIGGLAGFPISSKNLPVGISTIGNATFISYAVTTNGAAGLLCVVLEVTTSYTDWNFTATSTTGAPTAFAGFIDLMMVTS